MTHSFHSPSSCVHRLFLNTVSRLLFGYQKTRHLLPIYNCKFRQYYLKFHSFHIRKEKSGNLKVVKDRGLSM